MARIGLPLKPIRVVLGAGSVWVSAQRVLSARGTSIDATVFRIDPATNRIVARIPLRTHAVDGILVSHGAVWAAIPASQEPSRRRRCSLRASRSSSSAHSGFELMAGLLG